MKVLKRTWVVADCSVGTYVDTTAGFNCNFMTEYTERGPYPATICANIKLIINASEQTFLLSILELKAFISTIKDDLNVNLPLNTKLLLRISLMFKHRQMWKQCFNSRCVWSSKLCRYRWNIHIWLRWRIRTHRLSYFNMDVYSRGLAYCGIEILIEDKGYFSYSGTNWSF